MERRKRKYASAKSQRMESGSFGAAVRYKAKGTGSKAVNAASQKAKTPSTIVSPPKILLVGQTAEPIPHHQAAERRRYVTSSAGVMPCVAPPYAQQRSDVRPQAVATRT